MKRYQITQEADGDLQEIWLYISQDDPAAAEKLLSEILSKFELLAEHPLAGRLRPELSATLRSFAAGNYVLFYRPTDKGAEIIRVLHASRDLESQFTPET